MITIEQIKAARSLLRWNQQDLADAATMSKTALANIERGFANPRADTMTAIYHALTNVGVEFIEDKGVCLNANTLNVQIFNGEDALQKLWSDVYVTLRPGDERLISGMDSAKYPNEQFDKFIPHMHRFIKKDLRARTLIRKKATEYPDESAEYRIVNSAFDHDVPYYIYGNKYALLLFNPRPRIIIIENKLITENFRKQFDAHWEDATPTNHV